jgi:recombination protein RecT
MAETQDRTTTAGVQMHEDGMPAGQAPALPPRQAQQLSGKAFLEKARAEMMADVERHRADLMKLLVAYKIDFDLFEAGLRIFLLRQQQTQPEFFTKVTPESFMEALFRCAKDGLIPDGKEAAIGHFKGVATYMPMRDGFVKVLWRTGMIKDINDNVVTVAEEAEGRFEYEEGSEGYVRHRPSMTRTDADIAIAAYCVINLVGGGQIREVVNQDELKKIEAMSRSPARKEWKFQMSRKAAIRRVMGKMPREAGIAQLLGHDDMNYESALTGPAGGAKRALTPEELVSGRVARPKRKGSIGQAEQNMRDAVAHAEAEGKDARDKPEDTAAQVVEVIDGAEPAAGDEHDYSSVSTALQGAETATELVEAIRAIEPLIASMDDDDRAWAQQEIDTAKARLLPADEEEAALEDNGSGATIVVGGEASGDLLTSAEGDGPRLFAVMTSADGVTGFFDAGEWQHAILGRMNQLEGAKLAAFWKANLEHVLDAGEQGVDEAETIMDAAAKHGLPQVQP